MDSIWHDHFRSEVRRIPRYLKEVTCQPRPRRLSSCVKMPTGSSPSARLYLYLCWKKYPEGALTLSWRSLSALLREWSPRGPCRSTVGYLPTALGEAHEPLPWPGPVQKAFRVVPPGMYGYPRWNLHWTILFTWIWAPQVPIFTWNVHVNKGTRGAQYGGVGIFTWHQKNNR